MPERREQSPRQPVLLTQHELNFLQAAKLVPGKKYPKLEELGLAPGSGKVLIQIVGKDEQYFFDTDPDWYGTITTIPK